MSSKLSQKNNIYAEPHPQTVPIAKERDHLTLDDVIRCDECGAHITIDPSYPHIEYGHRRVWNENSGKGRCSHRPEKVENRVRR